MATEEKTKTRLREEFRTNKKHPMMILNELGYKENEHFRCEESEKPTGVGTVKVFFCQFKMSGRAFPKGEGANKKDAKKNAASHVVSHLLGVGSAAVAKTSGSLNTKPVGEFAGIAGVRVTTDSGKTSSLRDDYKTGKKTPAQVLHEYVDLMHLQDKPRYEECPSPNAPFGGVWFIGSKKYPEGAGSSKQEARQNAAKKVVDRLFVNTDVLPSPPRNNFQSQPNLLPNLPSPRLRPAGPVPALGATPPPASGAAAFPAPLPLPIAEHKYVYTMRSRRKGYILLINNVSFPHEQGSDQYREGSNEDAERISTLFTKLGFIIVRKDNLKAKVMLDTIEMFAKSRDHAHVDCTVLVILSHGSNGSITGTDSQAVEVEDIIEKYKASNARDLAGKPKLFIIQACRGTREDYVFADGVQKSVQSDSSAPRHAKLSADHVTTVNGECIPERADFLICYATNPGMAAYRWEAGSVFIQKFCQVVERNAASFSMLDILTMVNSDVADFEGLKEKNKKDVKVKQISEFSSSLRKVWKLG